MSNSNGRGRTVALSLLVVLALIVLVVTAVLVFSDRSSSDTGAPVTTTVPAETSSTATSTSSETTTTSSPPETTRTRPTGEPGSVTYQLTGNGEVVGAAYRSGNSMRVVAITGTPWQQRTTVTGKRAELTAIVIRGRITCTIMQGEELLTSSTSSGGPISCRTKLPK